MKNTKQPIDKLTASISLLTFNVLRDAPDNIASKCIVRAKTDVAKERLVRTAILLAEEDTKRCAYMYV